MEDELESLREKSTRASSVYDDLEGEGRAGGGGIRGFSPQQWFILVLLLFLDIIALAVVILVWTGTISF